MSKQFIQMTSGWIPIAVMGLLAAALIAGQARANLPDEHRTAPVPAVTAPVNIVLSTRMLTKLDALPEMVESLLAMPIDVELRFDTRILRGDVPQEKVSPLKSH